MKRLLLLSVFLAGCPEQIGQQCPARTVSIGQFALAFAGRHDAGECIANIPEAGPTRLTLDDGGTRSATLCFGTADGGPQLQLLVPGKTARPSDLLADGGFHFIGAAGAVVGTACGGTCPVAIDESFDGYLLTSPADAGFAVQSDGGLPEVTGLTGSLTDNLTSPDTSTCLCTLPCPITYGITGTRF